jgi:L-iditol 2-dehydrogenase
MGNPHRDTLIDYRNHSRILRKEIALGGVWNSVYAEYPMNEWKYTVEMIEKKELAVRDLITHRSDLEHLPGLFDGIHDREVTICKAIYSAGISQATDRRM